MSDRDPVQNRPGLPALSYRIGTFSSFRQRLLSQLLTRFQTNEAFPRQISLDNLTTRDSDDPAIALLDAVAVVADVLTFYQERIINEGYLNTATERRSVLELARMIGYELSPGVAASTVLSFTVDNNPGSPAEVLVPKGTQVLSIPGQDEFPQTFETSEDLLTRPEWNAIVPRPKRPQQISKDTHELYLSGISTQLQANSPLLLMDGDRLVKLLTIETIEPIATAGYTRITWKEPLHDLTKPLRQPQLYAFRDRPLLWGNNAPQWNTQTNEIKRANGGTMRGGVFHQTTVVDEWTSDSIGLPTVNILSLTEKSGIRFAGTSGSGIFRSQQQGASWQAVNTGLTNLTIQVLYTSSEGHLYAGTPSGGVFRSKDDGENWTNIGTGSIQVERKGNDVHSDSTGIPNTVVRSLLTYTLPKNLVIQEECKSPTSEPQPDEITYILAGTDQGIYRSCDQGKNWGLKGSPGNIVYNLAKRDRVEPGRLFSSGTTVIGVDTNFSSLKEGDIIYAAGQAKTVQKLAPTSVASVVRINSAFSQNLSTEVEFSVKRQGTGTIATLNAIVEINPFTFSFGDRSFRIVEVTLQGVGIPPRALDNDDTISFSFQGRIVSSKVQGMDSNGVIFVDHSFLNNNDIDELVNNNFSPVSLSGAGFVFRQSIVAPVNSGFSRTRRAQTKIRSQANFGIGNSDLTKEVQLNDEIQITIQVNNESRVEGRIVQEIVPSDRILTIDSAFSNNLSNESFTVSALFAATDRGVFQSQNNGENWIPINTGLAGTDLDVRSILTTPNNTVYAGTASGKVFRLEGDRWIIVSNPITTVPITALHFVNQVVWAGTAGAGIFYLNSLNQWIENHSDSLLSLSVTSLAGKTTILAGTRFIGFVEDETNGGTGEWKDFDLAAEAIDLDSLYPRIISDSLVALKEGEAIAVHKVKSVSTPTLNQFTLNSKVTRLELDPSLDPPSQFNRRTTQVLATSELLPLANESLTVAIQQTKIFADPIQTNTIYLSEFVAGLQPQQLAIVTGKRIRLKLKDIAGIFQSTNNGNTWSRSNTGLVNTGATALVTDSQTQQIYAGTISSGVFRSRDQGKTWEPLPGLPTTTIQTLAVSATGTLFAGTSTHGLFGFDGEAWHNLNVSRVHQDVRAIAISPNRQVILIGTANGGVFRSTNALSEGLSEGSLTWTQTTLNNTDVQALVVISQNADESGNPKELFFAGTAEGLVYRSLDRGVSWQSLEDGTHNLLNVTALALTEPDEEAARFLLAGTAGSGIFRWKLRKSELDGDESNQNESQSTWEIVNTNLTDLNIRCLRSIDSVLFAGTTTGGVFRSNNNGELWAATNAGITSTDAIDADVVNIDLRAIASLEDQLFVAGTGILVSPDRLSTAPIKAGDELQLLAPPSPLQADLQRWQLQDKDQFIGVIIANSQDVELKPAVADDPLISELAVISKPPDDQQLPILELVDAIQGSYDPETVRIQANVVRATHGETVREVLGSGDGAATHQSFVLKKPPLTYVSASTPSGSEPTLEVRVNDVRWQTVDSLYERSPLDPVYLIRRADDGTTSITFGDGRSGARLPSGQENITAVYRSGIGRAGQVAAHQLSLLKTRPFGITEVTNPLPATGAADPETMVEARTSAPLTVRTLDRIVSLQDYEDFAGSFAGIGKAQAIVLWNGEMQQVHITIAANQGGSVLPGTALYENLVQAINTVRDPLRRVQVDSYEPILFNLEATLLIDPNYLPEKVTAAVRSALLNTFTFEKRAFAQPVTASEAIAAMQAIPGIIAVDLDALYRRDATKRLEQVLSASSARLDFETNQIRPAQLLLLNPNGMTLKGVKG